MPEQSSTIENIQAIVAEPQRLDALHRTELLDTPAEEAFDRLTRLASRITGSPISLISLVDADRQFFKSLFGLKEPITSSRETPLSHSFCKHVVANRRALIVSDARHHPLLKDNMAILDLKVISYLGMPLTTKDGVTLGSFCVIDNKPRAWTDTEIEIIRELAQSTVTEIELRAHIRALENAEHQIENMTGMIVHDMRTPLTIIGGTLELLAQTTNKPDFAGRNQEMIQDALLATERVDHMIGDMLKLSQSEAGQLELFRVETDVESFIRLQEAIFRTQAELDQKRFFCEIDPGLPLVQLDPSLIARVIDNLVGNAIKYSPEKGTVRCTAVLEAGEIKIGVHDEGKGIDPQTQAAIFDKYFQARDAEGRATRRGFGLGLAFCKAAVEQHGGRIWVESTPGQGSSFYFTLPPGG